MFDKLLRNTIVNTATVAFKAISVAGKELKKATPIIQEAKKTINPIIESTIDFTKNTIDEIMEIEIIKSIRKELKAISKETLDKLEAKYEREKRERIKKLQLEINALEKRDVELVFLDVEADRTGTRVREVSAIKVLMNFHNKTLKEIGRFERFYDDTREIFQNAEHDSYYNDNLSINDKEEFYDFAKDSEIMVSHNVRYDMKFFGKLSDKKRFCTMINNIKMTKLEVEMAGKIFYKFPKLKETAEFYNIPLNKSMLHTSMYDTYLCMKVFEKMMINNETQDDILYYLLGPELNLERIEMLAEESFREEMLNTIENKK